MVHMRGIQCQTQNKVDEGISRAPRSNFHIMAAGPLAFCCVCVCVHANGVVSSGREALTRVVLAPNSGKNDPRSNSGNSGKLGLMHSLINNYQKVQSDQHMFKFVTNYFVPPW